MHRTRARRRKEAQDANSLGEARLPRSRGSERREPLRLPKRR
jgi:hypothetical protein